MHTDDAEPSSLVPASDVPRAGAGRFRLDSRRSLVGFSVRHLTGRVHGTFMRVSGAVSYDPRRPDTTTVRVVIRAASVVTHNPTRDARLRSPEFFDARRFPEITFVSTSARRAGRRLEVTGDLTIRGVTCPVALTVGKLRTSGARATEINAVMHAVLRRSDFGVGPSSVLEGSGLLIGDEITVDIDLELVGD
ncbi:MAG TPA: YceI family protein [Polyangiaceae bacterium]|nr:YceI family protein [Polyangiaceae bacterium]